MPDIDWEAVNARKRELLRAGVGVIDRQRIIYEEFPEVAARHRALTSRRVEERVYELDEPATPDPDEDHDPPPHPFGGVGGKEAA